MSQDSWRRVVWSQASGVIIQILDLELYCFIKLKCCTFMITILNQELANYGFPGHTWYILSLIIECIYKLRIK